MAENPTDKDRAKKRKEMDTDGDGAISPQERAAYKARKQLEPDPVSKEELATRFKLALNVIYANEELKRLFLRAANAKDGQWTEEKFASKVRNTDWYAKGKFWREAWISEKEGIEWDGDLKEASEIISRRATDLGATIGEEELARLARRYLYEGWYDGTRAFYLDNALAKHIGKGAVGEGDIEGSLRTFAWQYGVDTQINSDWYTNAMRRVAEGKATLESLQAEIRDKAKSKYAPVADKIDQGQTTRDALGSYVASYASLLEVEDGDVDLNDPLLQKAWGGVDDQGKPKAMSVYDFETEIRKDPRWRETGNGRRETISLAQGFLESLGFAGGGRRGR